MNIPLIYKQLFYKNFVCLFDRYAIKDITVFKKLYKGFVIFYEMFSSISHFVRFSTCDFLFNVLSFIL